MRTKLIQAILDIYKEFDNVNNQPKKIVREIGDNVFCSIMPAYTENDLGCKIITWDENNGSTDAIIVRIIDGKIVIDKVPKLTAFRCGLMALSSIYQTFSIGEKIKLGIIGYGKIGKEVERLSKELYDVKTIVLESPRKNADYDPDVLSECDVIVTATTTRLEDKPLDYNPNWKSKLYISFDGGFILGPSFRTNLISKSDYPQQLINSFCDEFPFDDNLCHIYEFNATIEDPHCVYIYGTGISDLIAMRIYEDVREK